MSEKQFPADNKATLARMNEAVNSGDLERIWATIDDIFDPAVTIGNSVPFDGTGPDVFKQIWATLLRAYPDVHVTVEDVIADDDKLVVRNSVTGTNRGEYFGRPATGRAVKYDEIFVLRFAAGRIVETWGVVDVLTQMKQLGAIPA